MEESSEFAESVGDQEPASTRQNLLDIDQRLRRLEAQQNLLFCSCHRPTSKKLSAGHTKSIRIYVDKTIDSVEQGIKVARSMENGVLKKVVITLEFSKEVIHSSDNLEVG